MSFPKHTPEHRINKEKSIAKKMSSSKISPTVEDFYLNKAVNDAKEIIDNNISDDEDASTYLTDLTINYIETIDGKFDPDNDKDNKKMMKYYDKILGLALIKLGNEYLK